jgi:ribonucleotide reductase beta subunit family protein with ferritin-like domain
MLPLLSNGPELSLMVSPKMYKKAEVLFWTAEEMDLSKDIQDWNNWLNDKRHFAEGTVDVQEN